MKLVVPLTLQAFMPDWRAAGVVGHARHVVHTYPTAALAGQTKIAPPLTRRGFPCEPQQHEQQLSQLGWVPGL